MFDLGLDAEDCRTLWTEYTPENGFASHDPWSILDDDNETFSFSFSILGTSARDQDATPHVLSPPLMDALQKAMPFNKQGENFLLKYSLIRDGASIHTFLRNARGSDYTVLAIETVDGEVFGAFVGETWHKDRSYYGTGQTLLWRMRNKRGLHTHSVFDQAKIESDIDVFRYAGENDYVQLCTSDKIAVGGGSLDSHETNRNLTSDPSVTVNDFDWGAGLLLEDTLLKGYSSPCLTYGSPSLSKVHKDGSSFEITNIELWTLTPCLTVEEAEKLELRRLFLEKNSRRL